MFVWLKSQSLDPFPLWQEVCFRIFDYLEAKVVNDIAFYDFVEQLTSGFTNSITIRVDDVNFEVGLNVSKCRYYLKTIDRVPVGQ